MSEDLDARMKAAGMLSISEMLARNPLGDFAIHKDVKDLASFEQWLILRRKESLELQARMELDKERGDELYEWAIAHSAVFGEVLINYRAAIARICEVAGISTAPRKSHVSIGYNVASDMQLKAEDK